MLNYQFNSVQSLSHVRLFVTLWTAAHQAFLSITNSQSLLKPMSTESVMPSNYLILCIPFSSCPQSFPASGSFPVSWLFASCGQRTEVSASTSVLPMNTQDWSPLGWTGWSPCHPRDSQGSYPTPHFKIISSFALSFFIVQLSHPYKTTGKTIALTRWTFVDKVMSLFFNMLSMLVITYFQGVSVF